MPDSLTGARLTLKGIDVRTDLPATWFRLYAEFSTDPKVQMLSEVDQRRFILIMCLRCCNGHVTLQDSEVAFQLRISEAEWSNTKSTLLAKNLIGEDNKPIAWEKRQFDSDTSNSRVAKHREKKKLQRNVTVAPLKRKSNAPETETETENIKPKSKALAAHEKIEFDGNGFQGVNGYLEKWRAAFPAVDISQQIAKAEAWLIANPKNQKSNYARFLTNWMQRAQDYAPSVSGRAAGTNGVAHMNVGDRRAETIAGLTGRNIKPKEQDHERDITGDCERIS